jgi:hypothetical protein
MVIGWGLPITAGFELPALRSHFAKTCNTLDDPFYWTPATGVMGSHAAGMHFVAFVPASSKFHTARRPMDGVLPDGTNCEAPFPTR